MSNIHELLQFLTSTEFTLCCVLDLAMTKQNVGSNVFKTLRHMTNTNIGVTSAKIQCLCKYLNIFKPKCLIYNELIFKPSKPTCGTGFNNKVWQLQLQKFSEGMYMSRLKGILTSRINEDATSSDFQVGLVYYENQIKCFN